MAEKSKFELAVIDAVTKVRIEKGYTQDDLAEILDVTRGFIGQVESPNFDSKYNLDHINRLANAMNCSPRDFLPEKPIQEA